MATTAKKKPAATAAKQPRQQGLSDMQRWMLGVILFVVGLLILLSVISYFFLLESGSGHYNTWCIGQ